MSRKPDQSHDEREVIYDGEHWKCLDKLRTKAKAIIQKLQGHGCEAFVFGSVARGDIKKDSDIDIVLMNTTSSFKVELAVGSGIRRELVQATPSSVLKAHLHLDEHVVVSFPIFKMLSRERDFYRWGGLASYKDLESGMRKEGVDKRLVLIVPTQKGHREQGVIGREAQVAKLLQVSTAIAHERVRVLLRRDTVGRTGVYRTYLVQDDETFEEAAKRLGDSDPALRRTMRRRQIP